MGPMVAPNAGNCSFFHGNYYCTQVNMKSIEIYQQLEAETGQSVGWHTTGSIRTADNPGRMEEPGYIYSMNRCQGVGHWGQGYCRIGRRGDG